MNRLCWWGGCVLRWSHVIIVHLLSNAVKGSLYSSFSILYFLFLGAFGKIYHFLISHFRCSCFSPSYLMLVPPFISSGFQCSYFVWFSRPVTGHMEQHMHGPWHKEVSIKGIHLWHKYVLSTLGWLFLLMVSPHMTYQLVIVFGSDTDIVPFLTCI